MPSSWHRKASAEKRLDAGLAVENTNQRTVGRTPDFGDSVALGNGGQWEPACTNAGNSKLGLEGPFLDLFSKHVLQTEAPALERINEQEGCFSLFPRKQNARICRCMKVSSSTCPQMAGNK